MYWNISWLIFFSFIQSLMYYVCKDKINIYELIKLTII